MDPSLCRVSIRTVWTHALAPEDTIERTSISDGRAVYVTMSAVARIAHPGSSMILLACATAVVTLITRET